jgi:hypothetical protein
MLRGWPLFLGGLATVLAACAQPTPEPDGAPSRRLSTCRYRISFDAWSTAISPNGRAVLAEAVRTSSTNGSRGVIEVVPRDSPWEGGKIRLQRAEAIMEELGGRGIVREPTRTSVDNPGRFNPSTDLNVCDRIEPGSVDRPPMPPPSEIVPMEISGVRLSVPARLLYQNYWRDRPIEAEHRSGLSFNVAWPTLEPAATFAIDRRCRAEGICESYVAVSIAVRDPLSPELDAGGRDWLARQVRRAPGTWEGLRFDLPRNPGDHAVRFSGVSPDGSPVFGSCGMRGALPIREGANAEEVGRLLSGGDRREGTCRLYPRTIAGVLGIGVSFAPKDLANWNAIRMRVTEFAQSMVNPTALPEPPGEPSARVSACTYRVAFHIDSTALSPAALSTIDAAAAAARANGGAATIALRWFDFAGETWGVGAARMVVVSGALRRRGVSNEMTHAMRPSEDLASPARPPSIMITVCDEPTSEVLARLPAPAPDRTVPMAFGDVELRVPMVHLSRGLWVNPPIGVFRPRDLEAVFDWPSLAAAPATMRRDQVRVGVLPPARGSPPSASDNRIRSRHEWAAVAGTLEGLQLFIHPRARPVSEAIFVGSLQDGREVSGLCTWEPEPGQPETPTAEEIGAAIRRSPGDGRAWCRFQTVTGHANLRLDIRFGADVLADWRAIRERIPSAIGRYLREGVIPDATREVIPRRSNEATAPLAVASAPARH